MKPDIIQDFHQTKQKPKLDLYHISAGQKNKNMEKTQKTFERIYRYLDKFPMNFIPNSIIKRKFSNYFQELLEYTVPYDFSNFAKMLKHGFLDVSIDFYAKSRQFDDQLSIDEIYQSLRNIWVLSILKVFDQQKVSLNRANLSFSLLYPYSDNFLDDPNISSSKKYRFNKEFQELVFGHQTNQPTTLPEKIIQLVENLHQEIPIKEYPKFYQEVQALFHAQGSSISQQIDSFDESPELPLLISANKGATVVYANQELIKKNSISENLRDLLYVYGMIFQLVDDLEDLQEDRQENLVTYFTLLETSELLDQRVDNLKALLQSVNVAAKKKLIFPESNWLFTQVESIAFLLIDLACIQNPDSFSVSYLEKLEASYPIRFQDLTKVFDQILDLLTIEELDKVTKSLKK